MDLILWSWNLSPFAGKVRVVLGVKGLEHRTVEIDPRDRPARLRELNPLGRVPVLEVDGTPLRESSVICEFLEEVKPDPALWPTDALQRGVGRALLKFVDDELTQPFFLSMRKEAFGLEGSDHPDVVTHLRDRLKRNLGKLEPHLERGWLLGGEDPSLADLSALPLAVRLNQWRPDLAPPVDEFPRTSAWLSRLREHPHAGEVSRSGEPGTA